VPRAQFGRGEAEAVDRARREVLDEHVGARDHRRERVAGGVLAQVEADRFLAPVQPDEIGALALDQMVVAAGEVAFRPLDLDDPRAGFRQPRRQIGRGHGLLDRHDHNTLEIPALHRDVLRREPCDFVQGSTRIAIVSNNTFIHPP
jgi:hypothetical protein